MGKAGMGKNSNINAAGAATAKIYVTRPALPPLEELNEYMKQIWDSRLLTNNGPFHQELEAALADYLGVKYVSLFCNGMMALQTGLQALKITGEVITTPYSFAATTHAIYWNRCTPVFADIDPQTLTLDPDKIESQITPDTTAILPVHVYGRPCDNDKLQDIADKYGLALFYDAAHAFGVRRNGESILNYGDLSMLSFHATKTFNTFEGGALITSDLKLKRRIDYLKNFGFADELTVVAPGCNGKMNELQAAIGLLQLKHFRSNTEARGRVASRYREALKNIPGISCLEPMTDVEDNYSYFPIFVDANAYGAGRDFIYDKLKEKNIYSRRYFYPLISHFPAYRNLPTACKWLLPVAEKVSSEVLCLPIYPDLETEIIDLVCTVIKEGARKP